MKANILNSSKRFLSALLCGVIIAGLMPLSINETYAAATQYDTSIFEGNAEYLLEEHFATLFETDTNGDTSNARLSGWDVDYRGGTVRISNGCLKINDSSLAERVSLKHEILSVKDGSLTFETALSFDNADSSQFSVQLGDGANTVMKLDFANGEIYYGNSRLGSFVSNEKIYIKADISLKDRNIRLCLNNEIKELDFIGGATKCSEIFFYTGNSQATKVNLYYVNAYVNYIVNERFLSADLSDIPCDFEISQNDTASGIGYAPGSAYADDTNGFVLENTNAVPNIELSRVFVNDNQKTTIEWSMILPQKQDGVKVSLKSGQNGVISVCTSQDGIYTGEQIVKSNYRANLWHKFQMDIDAAAKTYNLKINYKTVAENIPYNGGIVDSINFSKDGSALGSIVIDDISVYKSFEKYADYPSKPQISDSLNTDLGMVMYPMWREGMHFGWDTISPYADEREPLMGYYTEGQREVADWQNKWMAEHGVDFALYPFVRPNSTDGEPVKKPVRSEDLNDGYLNSEYSADIDFAVFLSAYSISNYHGADEFIENVIPYLSEYYFSDPRYKVIGDKLPVFVYSLKSMCDNLGGTEGVKSIIQAFRAEAQRLGFSDIVFCADAAGDTGHSLVAEIGEPIRIWSYTSFTDNADYIMEKTREEYEFSENYIPSISVGYDTTPWRDSQAGIMSSDDLKSICDSVKKENGYQSSNEKIVLFTCWNEYGEGHYFAPSNRNGFDFLNVIRDEFTADGEKLNETVPGAISIARMEALYPNNRKALKIKEDMKFTAADLMNRDSLYKYSFSDNSHTWTTARCTAVYSSNTIECSVSGNDPYIACDIDTQVDISNVKAVRIRAYTKGVHELNLLYKTSDNAAYGDGKIFTATRVSGTDGYSDYIMYPTTPNPMPTGTITGFRIDPTDNIDQKGAKFGIAELELYGDTTYKKYQIDGIDAQLTSAPVTYGNKTYIPVYGLLINEIKAYPIWNEAEKTLTAYKDGRCIVFKAGSSNVIIDGNEFGITAPIFDKGNLFVPYDEFFAVMNYTMTEEEDKIICTSNEPLGGFDISVSATGYGDNLMIDYGKSETGDFNLYNVSVSTTPTEDDKTALVLEPTGTTAIFSVVKVNSGGKKVSLSSIVAKGGKMKVSFLYKGTCTGMRVENRPASGSIEEMVTIPSVSDADWNSFEYIFDNSKITGAANRWLSIRVTSNTNSSPCVYITDFKIQCQETVADNFIDGSDIEISVTAPTNQAYGYSYDVIAAEYNADSVLVNYRKLYRGDTTSSETGTTQNYTPQSGDVVKFFVWNNMRPMCEFKTLTRQ